MTVASESLPANVLQGKKLFYDAQDDRLARDNYLSCASCHNDGGGDGRVWDLTGFGEGLRNTVDLRGRAGMGQGPCTGPAFDEVQDSRSDPRARGAGLMSVRCSPWTRAQPLGIQAGLPPISNALAAYVASLTTAPGYGAPAARLGTGAAGRRRIRRITGAGRVTAAAVLPTAQRRAPRSSTIGAGSGSRLGAPLDGFDTPTLGGVWATAPYLHDGSAATPEAAIAAHANHPTTPADRVAIAAFLTELNPGDAQPLPEPGAAGALGAGVAALAVLYLRRRRGRAK